MAKPKTHESKQVAFRLRLNLRGWLDLQSREHGGISSYINDLIEADRMAHTADPESANRYRTYLDLFGYDEELASLDEQADD